MINKFNTNTTMKHTRPEDLYTVKHWRPKYGRYNLDIILKRLEDISQFENVDAGRLQQSEQFVRRVFDQYWSKQPIDSRHYEFVFAVPTRIRRGDDEYHSEAASFLPIIQDLDSELAQLFISELPPCVIEEYPQGAIVFVPLFSDLLTDYRMPLLLKRRVNAIVDDTAKFIASKLHANIVGLGGTLPKITSFGAPLRKHGLQTTTGHGGTATLIGNIFDYFYRQKPADSLVGIIGCGAIGEATADLLLSKYPDLRICMHDKREKYQLKIINRLKADYGSHRVYGAGSNTQLLADATIIISAITSSISIPSTLDLTGKIIIDDSQPGSFDGNQVRAHDGTLVWVVGHDTTKTGHMRRIGGYSFGEYGLAMPGDVWGCEAEVAAIWAAKRYDLRIESPVTVEQTKNIGQLFDEVGVGLAQWQEHGRLLGTSHGLVP